MAKETYEQMMDRMRRAAQKAAGKQKPTGRQIRRDQQREEAAARGDVVDFAGPSRPQDPTKDDKGHPTRRKKRTPEG